MELYGVVITVTFSEISVCISADSLKQFVTSASAEAVQTVERQQVQIAR